MGACGCGDYDGRWRFPGPDGAWYVVGVYGGCEDCQTPAGVSIDLMGPGDLEFWEASELPIIGGPDHPNFGIPVIDGRRMEKAVVAAISKDPDAQPDEGDPEFYIDGSELCHAIRTVAYETANDFDDARRKFESRSKD